MFKDIVGGLSGILNKEAKDMISVFAMVLIPMGLMWSIIFLPQLLMKEINKPEKCWEVQSVNGEAYKVNTCTGALELISERNRKNALGEPAAELSKDAKTKAESAPEPEMPNVAEESTTERGPIKKQTPSATTAGAPQVSATPSSAKESDTKTDTANKPLQPTAKSGG